MPDNTIGLDVAARDLIIREIYIALERLNAPAELLGVVGSWGDTMSDHEVLQMLRDYNRSGTIFSGGVVCAVDPDEER